MQLRKPSLTLMQSSTILQRRVLTINEPFFGLIRDTLWRARLRHAGVVSTPPVSSRSWLHVPQPTPHQGCAHAGAASCWGYPHTNLAHASGLEARSHRGRIHVALD
jgi:hypothetical protein